MEKRQAEARALFRYGLIASVLHEQGQGQMKYFREIAKKEYQVPGKQSTVSYSVSTLKDWLRQYRRGGIDALFPAIRKDAGVSKKIDAGIAETISTIFADYPDISAAAMYRMLVKRGTITKEIFTEVTLRNYIRKNNLRSQLETRVGRKKFEMPAANMLWTMDFLHGPQVIDKWAHNRKRKVYLCAIIDDHSRLIVGAQFAFAENSMALATTLKAAVLQYGIPQKVYCDNGSAFSTHTLQLACARIGMALIHSKAYDSPSRGKIERFNLNENAYRTFYIPLATVSVTDFYRQLNYSLGNTPTHRKTDLFRNIQEGIKALVQNRKIVPVFIFDEVHLMKTENFSELQIILNFDYDSVMPAIVILAGQSHLRDRLARDIFTSFDQRIALKYHLIPLGKTECTDYILSALKQVGGTESLLSPNALEAIFNNTQGNLREIANLTTKALLATAIAGKNIVTEEEVFLASKEV